MFYSGKELFFLPSSSNPWIFGKEETLMALISACMVYSQNQNPIHDNGDYSILLDMIQKQIKVIILIKTCISYSRANTWSVPNWSSPIFKM